MWEGEGKWGVFGPLFQGMRIRAPVWSMENKETRTVLSSRDSSRLPPECVEQQGVSDDFAMCSVVSLRIVN